MKLVEGLGINSRSDLRSSFHSSVNHALIEVAHFYFTGKQLDDETSLYYYGYRYYNPSLGRFITADPTIQHPNDPQDLNRYAYTRNNPVNLVDPTGLGFWKKLLGAFKNGIGSFIGGIVGSVVGAVIGYAIGGPFGAAVGAYIGGSIGAGIGSSIQHRSNVLIGAGRGLLNGIMAAPFVIGGYAIAGPLGAIVGATVFSVAMTGIQGGSGEDIAISSIVTATYATAGSQIGKVAVNKALQVTYGNKQVGNRNVSNEEYVAHTTTRGKAEVIVEEGVRPGTHVFDANETVNGVKIIDMTPAQRAQALGGEAGLSSGNTAEVVVMIPKNAVALAPAPSGATIGGVAGAPSQAVVAGIYGVNVPVRGAYVYQPHQVEVYLQDPISGEWLGDSEGTYYQP